MQRHSSSDRSVGYLLLSMARSVGHHHTRRDFPDSLSRQLGEYGRWDTSEVVELWDNGQIVEENLMYDLVTFMKQIGLSD